MAEKTRVLIIGSNGMLGKDIVNTFKTCSNLMVLGINRKIDSSLERENSILCDITNYYELGPILQEVNPNIIIHCAAAVDVDSCEKDRAHADKLNIEAVASLSSFRSDHTKFVYISTDSVFDGESGNYSESSRKNPLNYYAFTKSKGEEVALKSNRNCIVLRTNIYGFHKEKGNSLVEWALDEFLENRKLKGFNDVYFNPVYTKQLARAIYYLISSDYSGILNVGATDYLSKYEFLLKLARTFKVSPNLIEEISVDTIVFSAKRPKNTTLSVNLFEKIFKRKLFIDAGLQELYHDYKHKEEYVHEKN